MEVRGTRQLKLRRVRLLPATRLYSVALYAAKPCFPMMAFPFMIDEKGAQDSLFDVVLVGKGT